MTPTKPPTLPLTKHLHQMPSNKAPPMTPPMMPSTTPSTTPPTMCLQQWHFHQMRFKQWCLQQWHFHQMCLKQRCLQPHCLHNRTCTVGPPTTAPPTIYAFSGGLFIVFDWGRENMPHSVMIRSASLLHFHVPL